MTRPNDSASRIAELERELAQLRAAQAAKVDGSVIGGDANVQGHLIGRDSITIIHQHFSAAEDRREVESVVAHYLDVLVTRLSRMNLKEIDVSAVQDTTRPVALAEIYVPLDSTLQIPKSMAFSKWFAASKKRFPKQADKHAEDRPVAVTELLAEHSRLTLLGAAGSGKSTFGNRVLLALAQAWQGHAGELKHLGTAWTRGDLFPVQVIARRFADGISAARAAPRAGDVWAFIGAELKAAATGLSPNVLEYIQRITREHGALIVLDGLDECKDPDTQRKVLSAFKEFADNAGAKSRLLLTARPSAAKIATEFGAHTYTIANLSPVQSEAFVRAWYAARVDRKWSTPDEAGEKIREYLSARNRREIAPLTKNPLLLTLLAALQANHKRLPGDRVELYKEAVDLLMQRWTRAIDADTTLLQALNIGHLTLGDLLKVLGKVAFDLHKDSASASEDTASSNERVADIGADRLERAFLPTLGNDKNKPEIVIHFIEERVGLLRGEGGVVDGEERRFAFIHRSFQEYLAAVHLAGLDGFAKQCAELAHNAPSHWQLALTMAARIASGGLGFDAADELIHGEDVTAYAQHHVLTSVDSACARIAGLQLVEIGLNNIDTDRRRVIARKAAGWIAKTLSLPQEAGGEYAKFRAEAGDVLSAVGDPRTHLIDVDHMRFSYVPSGPFWLGEKGKPDAKPHLIDYGYWIAQCPVTVAQMKQFVTGSGYKLEVRDALTAIDNRPVVDVSWRDAIAFCEWLTQRWQKELPGWRVVLPSEAEWEKAARGGEQVPDRLISACFREVFVPAATPSHDNEHAQRPYPWGDKWSQDHCNAEDVIGAPSTPGCFSAGRSPYDCEDMVGNVWEWTRSAHKKTYPPDDGTNADIKSDDRRVVRGGSWFFHRGLARCACRSSLHPGGRSGSLGFRLLLRPPC